jgi:hypothetical protein
MPAGRYAKPTLDFLILDCPYCFRRKYQLSGAPSLFVLEDSSFITISRLFLFEKRRREIGLPDPFIASSEFLSEHSRGRKPRQQAEPRAILQFTFLQYTRQLCPVEPSGLRHDGDT